MAEYHPQELDKKWQEHWAATNAFEVTEDYSKPKYYCLEMFAYPSGHAHVGHVRNYIIGDVVARLKRLQGFNVLHPFGWDAFGLPAENAAIKSGIHPETSTLGNIAHMKGQLQRLGISYAWERELATCLPDYYHWNQWLFTRMFERGIAYKRKSNVTWAEFRQEFLEHLDDAPQKTFSAYVSALNALERHCKVDRLAELTSERITYVAKKLRKPAC